MLYLRLVLDEEIYSYDFVYRQLIQLHKKQI